MCIALHFDIMKLSYLLFRYIDRLEEMRRNRKERSEKTTEAKAVETPKTVDNKADVDDLVNSLLVSDFVEPSTTKTVVPPNLEQAHNILSREEAAREKAKELGFKRSLVGINIYPLQKEYYDKGCQSELLEADYSPESSPVKSLNITPATKSRQRSSSLTQDPHTPAPEQVSAPEPTVKKLFSAEEQEEITSSQPFQSFLQSSSTVVERVLAQSESTFDYLRDYKGDADSVINSTENRALHVVKQFSDPCVHSRPVMDVQACPHYPELFVAAYGSVGQTLDNKNSWGVFSRSSPESSTFGNSPADAAGLACVWSLSLPNRPEFIFTATSPLLSAIFHPHDQHVVIGGCYSGQILLWDMRMKSLPVQRSSLAGRGHKHPVYCMHGVDASTSSNELITASTDGMVCHWDLTRLAEPTVTNNVSFTTRADGSLGNGVLFDTSTPSLKSACITSMSFGLNDGNRELYLGTDNGKLLKTALPIRGKDSSSTQVSYDISSLHDFYTSETVFVYIRLMLISVY